LDSHIFRVVTCEYNFHALLDAVNLNKLHSPKDLQFLPSTRNKIYFLYCADAAKKEERIKIHA
jgi:hypothetical protein